MRCCILGVLLAMLLASAGCTGKPASGTNQPAANAGQSPAAGSPQPVKWEELARIREAEAQIARDRFRRAAEGYDD